ncbi:hypothetical protein [Leekyejoonella antrihumi]|uniref:Uncharacterized protein n=1 Tax=Leekyejoonella antrihumi TaxID=1660198 RepID=A0A563DZY2_9MICO|nr:hypothetical protein [Leekyejoonella antrihumi]TWP35817.1 hypothetical protein FGL98_12475 [Leekyejoonella antrihumi]
MLRCYLASQRVDALGRRGFELKWQSGETLPKRAPAIVPKTGAAVSAYAEACGAHVADQIRRMLFTAYWRHGANIGDPEVLRTLLAATFMKGDSHSDPIWEFGYAVAMTREPITAAAWRLIRDWRSGWLELATNALPVVMCGSRVESGAAALGWLDELLCQESPVEVGVGGAPAAAGVWAPPTTVIPPPAWTSQIGDPWGRAQRMRQ